MSYEVCDPCGCRYDAVTGRLRQPCAVHILTIAEKPRALKDVTTPELQKLMEKAKDAWQPLLEMHKRMQEKQ